jgi:hypothetical protein
LSQTHDILTKITQIIQDIGLIRHTGNNTRRNKDKTKPEGKDLLYKHSPDISDNDEQSERDYIPTEDSKNNPSKPGPPSSPGIPKHCAPTHQTYPSSLNLTLHGLDQIHTSPEDSLLPTSAAFELDEPCLTGDTAVQYESSDSCTTSLGSSPPFEKLEQDSKEGIEGEECPDPGGVRGMTGEDLGGSVQ